MSQRKTPTSEQKKFFEDMSAIADRLEETLQPHKSSEGNATKLSLEDFRETMHEHQLRMLRAFLASERSIRRELLEMACAADPAMATAHDPPPIRSSSKSLDAICCALEQIRCGRLDGGGPKAAEWVVKKSNALLDKKIAEIVLTLAKPGYHRNRGKHGKGSARRKDLNLNVLISHEAWPKYLALANDGFCSLAFAALLMTAEYERDPTVRAGRLPNGIEDFLLNLGFYENEAMGYSAVIRDEGPKRARFAWGYDYTKPRFTKGG